MNRQIHNLFGVTLVMFGVLIAFTSRWTVFEQEALETNSLNRRGLIEEQRVPRGMILASDGGVLARSIPQGRGRGRTYRRSYPDGDLFAHPIGYSYIERGRVGLERSRNDALTGKLNEFGTIFRELQSQTREGSDLVTTLDPAGQLAARDALAGRPGSIVAVEPTSGRVRVMVSSPAYDPNTIPDATAYERLREDREGRPLTNRATQALYQPGSTFKVVTAAAALDSGQLTPDSIVDGSSPQTISGIPLANSGGANFGAITFTDALTNSVNTVFAKVGERVGTKVLMEYMNRLGFNRDPQLDYPEDEMIASGVRNAAGGLVGSDSGFDVGRVAIGQGGSEGQIQVTPLQMALVAAAVGNRGRLMRPRLTERIVGTDGRIEERIEPAQQSRLMKPESAQQLAEMMSRVVEEGTGTQAALSGVEVAGKTGTAEVSGARLNQVWFIGFAPVDNPRIAIAVTLEDLPPGTSGGRDAAPLAAQVLQVLLAGPAEAGN